MTQSLIEELKPPILRRKKYITEIPRIWEEQLFPKLPGSGKPGKPLDIMEKSYIIALTGPRGGVKSGSLAYLSLYALAKGYRVFTNLPVKCNLVDNEGRVRLLESSPLDIETLIMNPTLLEGSLIAWDEYQQHDRSGSHMTTQHQLLIGQWEQIRKQEISFAYVAKRINLVPGDIAWETDIEINCNDISKIDKGEIEGSRTLWQIKDLSGYWTRHMFDPRHPVIYPFSFYHRAIMGAYDTRQRFDPLEAKRGFKLDLQKRIISDHDASDDFVTEEDYQRMKEQAMVVLGDGPVRKTFLFSRFGVKNPNVKQFLMQRLYDDVGLREYMSSGQAMVRGNIGV